MSWSPKLDRTNPRWYIFETALENAHGIVLEGIKVIAQWSPSLHERRETISIGLHLGAARVYAIDVNPHGQHKNNSGRGRPAHGKLINGTHEHTWSEDGYGYAEDLDIDGISDLAVVWYEFLQRANIEFPYAFVHPDPALNAGQTGLFVS